MSQTRTSTLRTVAALASASIVMGIASQLAQPALGVTGSERNDITSAASLMDPRSVPVASDATTDALDLAHRMQYAYPESWGGAWWDVRSGTAYVSTVGDPNTKTAQVLNSISSIDPSVKFVSATYSWDTLTRAARTFVDSMDASSLQSVRVEEANDRVVVTTTTPAAALRIAKNLQPDLVSVVGTDRVTPAVSQSYRYADPGRRGGAAYKVTYGGLDPLDKADCTQSFGVTIGSAAFNLAAGHCQLKTHNYTFTNVSQYDRNWGVLQSTRDFSKKNTLCYARPKFNPGACPFTGPTYGDATLWPVASVNGYIFNGSTNTATLSKVKTDSYTSEGNGVCFSGANSGKHCPAVVLSSYTFESVCDRGDCDLSIPITYLEGPVALAYTYPGDEGVGGDSGSPVFSGYSDGVAAKGIFSANGDYGTTGYKEILFTPTYHPLYYYNAGLALAP